MIDDENDFAAKAALARAEDARAVGFMAGQRRGPALTKKVLIPGLVRFDSDRRIRAIATAFVMDDGGSGLVINLAARRAYPKGQVRILIVGGSEGFVEAIEFAP